MESGLFEAPLQEPTPQPNDDQNQDQYHEECYSIDQSRSDSSQEEVIDDNDDDDSQQLQQQRLIPLTNEITRAMMDFNGSQSSTSISEKPFYNTFSITSLVREEVHNILQELSIADQFIRKEEIDELIERCLKEKVSIVQDAESKTFTASGESDANQEEIEVTVEMLNETDKNKLIVENFQILEQRITSLEERISTVLQTIPKLRHLQAKKFKINTEAIREELRQFMDKLEQGTGNASTKDTTSASDGSAVNSADNQLENNPDAINKQKYDDMFYEQRQHAMNLLNYKKSIETLELNQRACLHAHRIKPTKMDLASQDAKFFKPKPKPVFVEMDV